MLGTAGGDLRRNIVKRVATRLHRGRDVREREGRSYLYDMFLDLILSKSWGEMGRNSGEKFISPANAEALDRDKDIDKDR
jgi:hypothetical protein